MRQKSYCVMSAYEGSELQVIGYSHKFPDELLDCLRERYKGIKMNRVRDLDVYTACAIYEDVIPKNVQVVMCVEFRYNRKRGVCIATLQEERV